MSGQQLTRAALKKKTERGEITTSQPPLGFRVAPDGIHMVRDELEQRAILRAKELAAHGLTLRAIAGLLNEMGFKNRAGNRLHASTIQRMVAGPRTEILAANPNPIIDFVETMSKDEAALVKKLVDLDLLDSGPQRTLWGHG